MKNEFYTYTDDNGTEHRTAIRGYVNGIPVVSMAAFQAITGVIISVMSGKLEDLLAVTTCKTNNPYCAENCARCVGICAYCFADRSYKVRKTAHARHMANSDILAADVLPVLPDMSGVKAPFIRFNSHGELVNVTNAINYLLIAMATPSKMFGFWTKRPDVIADAIDALDNRPNNVSVVISSLFVNVTEDLDRVDALYPRLHVDHVFTVFDADHYDGREKGAACHCGPRACINCGMCYDRNGPAYIAEKLR